MGGVPEIGLPPSPVVAEDFILPDFVGSASAFVRRARATWLFSSSKGSPAFSIEASFEFEGATGQVIRTESAIYFDRVTGVPTSVYDAGFSLSNPSVGPWEGAYRRWPLWEISGAHFRFFGQNWIRLIKVSGP